MVNIKGIIGNEKGEISLLSLIEQVQKETGDTVHVLIDSIGGDLEVGFSMYNYLLSLDKQIVTESVNNCASAATLPFIAGSVRIAGCPIMIHNPYIRNVSGDSEVLRSAADWIEEKERQAEAIYSQHTTLDMQTLSELMRSETYMSPAQAVTLGFATEAKQIALAKLSDNNNINKNEKKMSEKKKNVSATIRELLGLKSRAGAGLRAFALELTTAEGATLTVEREEGKPEVGDKASPDGSHTMTDGYVIVVEKGVIAEILEPAAEEQGEANETIAETIAEIEAIVEELKKELAQARAMAKSAEDISILNAVRMAGGAEKVFKGFKGVYKPQARIGVQARNRVQQTKTGKFQDKLAKLKQEKGI